MLASPRGLGCGLAWLAGPLLGVMLLAGPALAQLRPPALVAPAQTQTSRQQAEFWFDPTQLPTFTGTVERYLVNPSGETDALLFREGPQVVFPPDVADAVRAAAPNGRPLIVWGIRARNSPVITMLAFAPSADAAPGVVERLYWRLRRGAPAQAQTIAVAGTVKAPYYAPQGQVIGAVLEDGTVVLLPPGTAEPFRDLLKAGARLAAEGPGFAGEAGRALAAERLGETAETLRDVAATPSAPNPPAPDAQRQR